VPVPTFVAEFSRFLDIMKVHRPYILLYTHAPFMTVIHQTPRVYGRLEIVTFPELANCQLLQWAAGNESHRLSLSVATKNYIW